MQSNGWKHGVESCRVYKRNISHTHTRSEEETAKGEEEEKEKTARPIEFEGSFSPHLLITSI